MIELVGRHPHATTTSGRVRGSTRADGALADFRGIPYAEPPVGDLRWHPPVEPEPWSYVRECTKYGPLAWQRGGESNFARAVVDGLGLGWFRTRLMAAALKWAPRTESEDCLTLNVRAPIDADGLPVMVWYHGGDHTDGGGSLAPYRSDALPLEGCVLVTVNYRLGLFGFFAHPELASETDEPGNCGLLDQIAVLRWVRANAAAFGGDPDRVTIFGESAGGQAVLNLMCAPAARGLFHRAIAQSPSDSGLWLHRDEARHRFEPAEQVAGAFADRLVGPGPGQLDRLRGLDAADLMAAYRADEVAARHCYPTIGCAQLAASPFTVFTRRGQAPVPLIAGVNADEGSAFAATTHPAGGTFDGRPRDPGSIRAALVAGYGDDAPAVEAAYPGLVDDDRDAVSAHLGDRMFGVNVEHVTAAHADAGHPTHRYEFRATPASPGQTIGAFHAAEIGPLFDVSLPLVPRGPGYAELGEAMRRRWVAMAAAGRPTPDDSWPTFDLSNRLIEVFDRPDPRGAHGPARTAAAPLTNGLEIQRRRFARLLAEDTG